MTDEIWNLKAVPAQGSVKLTWGVTSTNYLVGFDVVVTLDGQVFQRINNLPPTAREYTVTGLDPTGKTRYAFNVRADVEQGGRTVEATPLAPPPPPPPPPPGVLWKADGETAGPTNNPFLEWTAYSGPGGSATAHPGINLVQAMDEAHGAHPPLQGKYMYRHELTWWENDPAISLYGDRLELGNEAFGSGSSNPQGWPPGVSEWKEGTELWVAFGYYIPKLSVPHYEVKWSGNYYGALPICQFHGAASAPPTFGAMIQGTRERRKNEGPIITPTIKAITSGNEPLWEEELRPDNWYKFLYHFKISATDGLVESWGDNGDGSGFSKYGKRELQTLDAEFMFPCQGGPRNEMLEKTGTEVPPVVISYHDCWTFATTREAAEAGAFG